MASNAGTSLDRDDGSIYQPLNKDNHEVRLMRVLRRGAFGIECEVETFSMLKTLHYKALSYCCTTADATLPIRLNGKLVPVRPNLHAYLEVLADENDTSWHFVDAISINGDDLGEKSHQIRLMRSIYSNADRVIAWLGEDTLGRPSAELEAAQYIHARLRALMQEGRSKALMRSQISPEEVKAAVEEMRAGIELEELVRLAAPILESDYWRRLWIVQELVLSRRLTFRKRWLGWDVRVVQILLMVFCCEKMQPVHTLGGTAIEDAGRVGDSSYHKLLNTASQALKILKTRIETADEERRSILLHPLRLHQAIEFFSQQECTLRHDKVFGLMGLTYSLIRPDYDMPSIALFLRTFSEGVLEFRQRCVPLVVRSPTDREDWIAHPEGAIYFQRALLSAFGLSIDHPTVALAVASAYKMIWGELGVSARRIVLSPGASGNFATTRSKRRFRKKIFTRQLGCTEQEKQSNLPQVDGVIKTYDTWVREFTDVVHSVIKEWNRYRDKTAATASERRMHERKWSWQAIADRRRERSQQIHNYKANLQQAKRLHETQES